MSLGQARILEEERERVIRVYREMKEIRAGARVELEKGAEKRSGEKRKRVHNGT